MKIFFTFSVVVLFSLSAIAQEGSKLQKLGENINSSANESQPILTPKGDTLFFIRSAYDENTGGRYSGQDIWYSTKKDGVWQPAKNTLENLNSADNNAIIGINSTGDQIYLINSYSPPLRRNRGVVYARKDKGIWSIPKEIDLSLNIKGDFYGFYMHPQEDVLIISMNSEGTLGEEDLYVSVKTDGKWSKPIHLGEVVNTEGFEISPFLTAGKDSLFFASNGHGGLGEADIYVSKRLGDGWQQWSKPVNLGEPVNSSAFDAYYFEHGNQAYFSSTRDGNSDIFAINIEPQPVSMEEPTDSTVVQSPDSVETVVTKKEEDTTVDAKVPEERKEGLSELLNRKYDIYFAFDAYQIGDDGKETLRDLVAKLKKYDTSAVNIIVAGYTDSVGAASYNQELSRKRAEQVAAFLKEAGMNPSDIHVTPKGEANPAATNDTPEGRAKNRRAEVTLKQQ